VTPDAAPVYAPIADEEAEAVLAACRVLVAVSAQSIAAVESVVDLTEFRILVILATLGTASTSQLADTAEVHHATARRLCDRLIAVKLVTITEPDPASDQILALSAQGQGVVHMVMSRRRAAIEPILAQMPATDRADVVSSLRQFAHAAGEPSLRDLWAMGWTQ
jgi:DNA-binding MarR family transcriptional regulator